MQNPIKITTYISIIANVIKRNGEVIFVSKEPSYKSFAEEAYRTLQVEYPKFHKMDSLSKLGFLAAEYLVQGKALKKEYVSEKIGIVVSNKSSCLDTDVRYYDQVKKGIASPAVFVYSLPNILIGEICIRHGIKGENAFFISDKFDIKNQVEYLSSLVHEKTIDAAIAGWVELMGEEYHAFLYLVEKGKGEMLFTTENIEKIYRK